MSSKCLPARLFYPKHIISVFLILFNVSYVLTTPHYWMYWCFVITWVSALLITSSNGILVSKTADNKNHSISMTMINLLKSQPFDVWNWHCYFRRPNSIRFPCHCLLYVSSESTMTYTVQCQVHYTCGLPLWSHA